jgi:hypothetical protein
MFSHERSLVNRLKGRPFVLLGVNLDNDRATLRGVQEREQLNWRSWWDGRAGPIARAWNVEGLPTLILIDHEGKMRRKFLGVPKSEDLDKAIDDLLDKVK